MRIILVDDDPIVRQSLITIISAKSKTQNDTVEVIASGSNGLEAIELYDKHKPDLILLDIRMDQMDGLTAAENILDRYSDAKILFLTTFLDEEYFVKAIKIGAKGYIIKTEINSILPAIYAVNNNQNVFGNEIMESFSSSIYKNREKKNSTFSSLSSREQELAELVAEGLSNQEIADKMHLSSGTVRNYLSEVLDKLDLRDRTQLAIQYYKDLLG